MERRVVTFQEIPATPQVITEICQEGRMDPGVEVVFPCSPGRRLEDFYSLEFSLRELVMPNFGGEAEMENARATMSALAELLGKKSLLLDMPPVRLMRDGISSSETCSWAKTDSGVFFDIPTKVNSVHYRVAAIPLESHGAIRIAHSLSTESLDVFKCLDQV